MKSRMIKGSTMTRTLMSECLGARPVKRLGSLELKWWSRCLARWPAPQCSCLGELAQLL